jgi:two-component system chemotaxis response regulator CheB
MAGKNIRVMVVDDSAVMREIISDLISQAPGLEVIATANDGQHSIELLRDVTPDVITLDVQMPRMGGLETLDQILLRKPLPVIMVSSLTQMGAGITLDALDRGALDYIGKPENMMEVETVLGGELIRKIHAMAGTDVRRMLRIRQERQDRAAERQQQAVVAGPSKSATIEPALNLSDKCIAIGISTGGPPALASLFDSLQGPTPPIVIVQHMPPKFTKSFAWRLDSLSALSVKEAETGDILKPDHVYVAPGGMHLHLIPNGRGAKICVRDGDPVSGHKPSVDVMMNGAAEIYGDRCLGVIMTGMGRDGSDGCGAIKAAGGFVLGQDEATSDVYGMNKVAFREGHVDRQFSLDNAAVEITRQMRKLWARVPVGTS